MIIGFTGTRQDLTVKQVIALERTLFKIRGRELHHGDCVGADHTAHEIGLNLGFTITIHPPSLNKLRAYCVGDVILPPKSYLKRNMDIIDSSDVLIACPEGPERVRSGTWATVRMARIANKPVVIIYPDGTVAKPQEPLPGLEEGLG